jgi:hypothetical protein
MDGMEKVALYAAENGKPPPALVLDSSEGSVGHTKTASLGLLPEVQRFLDQLTPHEDCKYVLVNAMGASEYYGKNSNNDAFPEASLVHLPKGWKADPKVDIELSRKWPYGLPTFYRAGCFAHHRNQDHTKRLGDVIFVTWNDRMKRVELVMEIHKQRCIDHGGSGFWNSLSELSLPSVSMGCRVKFDRCHACCDLDAFYRALSKYDPKRHAHPGMAVLEEHMRLREKAGIKKGEVGGIRGIGRTRQEYCDCMKLYAGQINPQTGVQNFVYNDFPDFFDISLVGVPADRTARGIKIISISSSKVPMTSVTDPLVAFLKGLSRSDGKTAEEHLALPTEVMKVAAAAPAARVSLEGLRKQAVSEKAARLAKRADLEKKIDNETPIEDVTDCARGEGDLPRDLLDSLARKYPTPHILGSAAAAGIILRPREFMRIHLVGAGEPGLANALEDRNICFGYQKPDHGSDVSERALQAALPFLSQITQLFCELLCHRSGFSPFLRERIGVTFKKDLEKRASSLSNPLLSNLGASYQGYRAAVMSSLSSSQAKLATVPSEPLLKIANLQPHDLFTPLSFSYFRLAFQDEVSAP